jgi:hypothetical protein
MMTVTMETPSDDDDDDDASEGGVGLVASSSEGLPKERDFAGGGRRTGEPRTYANCHEEIT